MLAVKFPALPKPASFFDRHPISTLSVLSFFSVPWRFRSLLKQFVRREIVGRYRGSMLGIGWAFVTPLLMLCVYTFVFVGVFKSRWPGAEAAGGMAFALRLFAGLMIFNLFAEVVGRAPSLILEQPNLVKKVVFPLELLPFVSLGSALFHLLLGSGILLVGILLSGNALPGTALLLPIVILPLLPLLLGLGWLLAALGVFVRDIATVVGLSINLLLFLSPVFYSVDSLAPRWRPWMLLSPLASTIENLRAVLFAGSFPDWGYWSLSLATGVCLSLAGAWVFRKTRNGFADVL